MSAGFHCEGLDVETANCTRGACVMVIPDSGWRPPKDADVNAGSVGASADDPAASKVRLFSLSLLYFPTTKIYGTSFPRVL